MCGKRGNVAVLDDEGPKGEEDGVAWGVEGIEAEGFLGGNAVAVEERLGGEHVRELVWSGHERVVARPLLTIVFEVNRGQRNKGQKKEHTITNQIRKTKA